MNRMNNRGMTLIECLMVLGILAVLGVLTIDGWHAWRQKAWRSEQLGTLAHVMAYARTSAIQAGATVVICPLNAANQCTSNWNDALSAFVDHNNDRVRASEEPLLQVLPHISKGQLKVAPANRKFFSFQADGTAGGTLGNVNWCPPDNDPKLAGQLILSRGGRVREATDRNGDGIAEDSQGRPIQCI